VILAGDIVRVAGSPAGGESVRFGNADGPAAGASGRARAGLGELSALRRRNIAAQTRLC